MRDRGSRRLMRHWTGQIDLRAILIRKQGSQSGGIDGAAQVILTGTLRGWI